MRVAIMVYILLTKNVCWIYEESILLKGLSTIGSGFKKILILFFPIASFSIHFCAFSVSVFYFYIVIIIFCITDHAAFALKIISHKADCLLKKVLQNILLKACDKRQWYERSCVNGFSAHLNLST